ncbi:tetraacyldisaccharide 4'-kinase [candidate division WOR-3 bacterium]|nr:tetraacyldisaccharide 4'-kinase [candidate division WOR-3 bacterium]
MKFLLVPLVPLYFSLYCLDKKIKTSKKTRFSAKTISVGNIEAGGTGKTQFVSYILSILERKNVRAAVLARGYGGSHRGFVSPNTPEAGDEVRMISRKFSNFPVVACGDRQRGYKMLIKENPGVEVIILDDGYQQYGIAKDLDILLLDWENPKAGGLIPMGSLREPLLASRRADLIIFTRTKEPVLPAGLARFPDSLSVPCLFCDFETTGVIKKGVSLSRREKYFFVSSIAKPERLLRHLNSSGFDITNFMFFRDHHSFSDRDADKIISSTKKSGCKEVLCTEKDAVKLPFECAIIESEIKWFGNSGDIFIKKLTETVL